MSSFKTGDFDKERVARILHPLVPAHASASLTTISLDELWARGKRLILLDVDNTLVYWKREEISPEVQGWVDQAKSLGFKLCILSNTRHPDRLARLSAKIGVETVRGRFKPSPVMYLAALDKYHLSADQAIMVGDQLFTDVLGANRAGIEAIWVRKLGAKEFCGTYISRMGEALLQGPLYRAIVTPVDAQPSGDETAVPLMERTIVRQFIKFAVVGGSSFVLDMGTRMVLLHAIPFHGTQLSEVVGAWLRQNEQFLFASFSTNGKAFYPLAGVAGTAVGILNSFVWNRRWTFQIQGTEGRSAELRRFVALSVTTAVLNIVISSFLNAVMPFGPVANPLLATIIATGIGTVLNFIGQRLYAFKGRV